MPNTIRDLLKSRAHMDAATGAGTRMHARMAGIMIDGPTCRGDQELIDRIKSNPDLVKFFGPASRPEMPIAGYVNGRFISRRIDRIVIDDTARRIMILDYKTDIDRDALRAKYCAQLREYRALCRAIYTGYDVSCYILWTHDWRLENILK